MVKLKTKVRGIITYRLSPFEQRAWAGAITSGLPNVARHVGNSLVTVFPCKCHTF